MLITGHDLPKINWLKKELNEAFTTKDLGSVKKILGMRIIYDKKAKKLWMLQKQYVEKLLERIHMDQTKEIVTHLAHHFKLSSNQSPCHKDDKDMKKIPYISTVGSLIYVMMCMRLTIAYAVGVMSCFLFYPRREHWKVVQQVLRYL